jgi:hypothetical protein
MAVEEENKQQEQEQKENPVQETEEKKETSEQTEQHEDKDSILKSLVDKIASLEEKLKAPEKPKEEEKPKTPEKEEKADNKNLDGFEDELKLIKDEIKKKDKVVSDYEGVLQTLIDSKLDGVSDDLKALIPESLNVKERLDWIIKAEKAGIFGQGSKGSIEIGKPLNPKDTKQHVDDSKLSASAKMALAYGSSKKKSK